MSANGDLSFGVVLQTDPPVSRVLELARRAEANGFTHGWTFDSHVLWQEAFVVYTLMLAETERMIVGPMVSNPGTRDWTVVASMFATLDQHFGPRTILGMGRGTRRCGSSGGARRRWPRPRTRSG